MMHIHEPTAHSDDSLPLLRLGFRPFYLLASAFAVVAIPLWLANYFGMLHFESINLLWHMHEMVFGFAIAVVIGFLFTAARNWTGLWTPRGYTLALFSLLWIAGRVAMAIGPPSVAALFDVPLIPCVAIVLYRLMRRSGNLRNIPLVGILTLISLANLLYHLAALNVLSIDATRPLQGALLLVILLSTVMGARVIPGFTASAAAVKTTSHPKLDLLAASTFAICFIAWTLGAPGVVTALFSFAGISAHFARMRGWQSMQTRHYPLLWILHLAYAWIGAGVLLLGLSSLGYVSNSSALHAMSIGAMGSLIIGMLTRTTRGHTGQKISAGKADVAMFAAIQLGAILRLCANLHSHGLRDTFLIFSGSLWSITFLLYLIVYAPALVRPRIDGREG